MTLWQILNVLFFLLLLNVAVETSCWQQRQHVELHGTHFPVWWLFLVFFKFFIVMDGISANKLFLKAMMEIMLKGFLQLWFACNMCQCFVGISLKFGIAGLNVTDNGMHWLSWRFCWWSSCFQLNWSIFWIFCMTTSFLYPLLTNYSIIF